MQYVSTRGRAAPAGFADVLTGGLAPDGGLWVPETYPPAGAGGERARFQDVAVDVLMPFVGDAVDGDALRSMVEDAYGTFDDPEVCPLRPLGDGRWLLELFHGPTAAFKDIALQLVGRLLDAELDRRGERATILVATSGDTGSAAIAGCVGRATLDIVVLHPAGRVSYVQRRQMTTVDAPNVHNLAVEGTFDDCQALVKTLLAEEPLRVELGLAAMNSINWARVAAQAVYYVWAVRRLGGPVSFSVPSGNFGNALAGWVAEQMGAEIEHIVVGTGRNDLLTRWLASGVVEPGPVVATVAPAMDIQVPSNLERLLFELLDRDGDQLTRLFDRLRREGRAEAPTSPTFSGARLDDDEIRAVMADTYRRLGLLVDPHTAVAMGAARTIEGPAVVVATAHPAKFPETVVAATGQHPAPPPSLAGVLARPERYDTVAADVDEVRRFVRRSVGAPSG
jgi:threonine synthase